MQESYRFRFGMEENITRKTTRLQKKNGRIYQPGKGRCGTPM
jgi:hypothetical protein